MSLSCILLFSLGMQMPNALDAIELVKHATLDMSDGQTVGKAFSTYPWFATGRWDRAEKGDGRTLVTFRGEWPDAPAAKDFHDRFRYSPKMSLMAMQLNSLYKLDKSKDRLAFLVDFLVEADGSFAVVSGRLGVREGTEKVWRLEELTDKALLRIIEGIFTEESPYVSLCKGLPYR